MLTDSPWLFYCQQPGYYNNRGPAWDPSAYRNDVYRIQLKATHGPGQQLGLTVADTAALAEALTRERGPALRRAKGFRASSKR